MLDQNTDRMWYVIGALVVGAGIILLANKALPEVFANISNTFNGTTDNALTEIGESFPNPNLVIDPANMDKLQGWHGSKVTYASNISVPEWDTTKAVRVRSTGGTTNTKIFRNVTTNAWLGEKVTISIYIKNLNDKPMNFYANGIKHMYFRVNPGEAKRIITTGKIRTDYDFVQFQYQALNPEESLDFLLYGQKIELGDRVTDYEE